MSRDDQLLLEDILTRINLTLEFVAGGYDEFMHSRIIQEAVIRNLEIIGEAVRNLSSELRDQYPVVPWREIAAFRNFAIHVYWDVKFERVWQIIEDDLPLLKVQIEMILLERGQEDS